MGHAGVPEPGELRRVLREQAGLDLAELVPADGGESAGTFLFAGQDGTVSVLKISPPAAGDSVARLRELAAGLRRRGYPAARLLASGQAAGMTFWLQERLPGTVPGPAPGWLLPEVIRLNDAQAGLGDGTRQLPGLIAATLTAGGDGYCAHATLETRPDTRDLLTSGAGICGVIDINPPALTGDRAFDLTTMLFTGTTATTSANGCKTAHSSSPAGPHLMPTSRT